MLQAASIISSHVGTLLFVATRSYGRVNEVVSIISGIGAAVYAIVVVALCNGRNFYAANIILLILLHSVIFMNLNHLRFFRQFQAESIW
jgi:hypothetical protein